MIKYILFLINFIKFKLLLLYFSYFPKPKQYTLSDKYKDFYNQKKIKLDKSLEIPEKMNKNITDLFYDIDKLNKYVNDNPDFEKKWKSRILITNNPIGNIYIYYDVYKMAFVYHSDTIMNNDLLNAAAIEYVTKYLCLDLYVNEKDIGKYNNKHLLALFKYNFDITDKKKDDILKKDVFVKKKQNKTEIKKNDDKKNNDDKEKEKKFYYNNKFIYGGKIRGINILNRKIIYPTNFKSNYLDNLSTQENKMSYNDFKKKFMKKI